MNEDKVYVTIYCSFDAECPLFQFNNKNEAKQFIERQYEKEIKNCKDDGNEEMIRGCCNGKYAQIVFSDDSFIEWNITTLKNDNI